LAAVELERVQRATRRQHNGSECADRPKSLIDQLAERGVFGRLDQARVAMEGRCAEIPSVQSDRSRRARPGGRLTSRVRLRDSGCAAADANRSTDGERQPAKRAAPRRSVRRPVHRAHPTIRLEVAFGFDRST
jgi:hypothetical protein